MDAKLVWDTWRRILRNDQLVKCVFHPAEAGASSVTGLNAEESAILAEYARTPVATDTNIGMYRRGLVRNALAALSLVPLTRSLLYGSGLDMDAVAEDFARSTGYRDDGPNFWRTAGDFVAYLAKFPELAGGFRQDLMALDAAMVALARRLGESAPAVWPETDAALFAESSKAAHHAATRFVASRAAVVVVSSHDLTPCLENPEEFDVDVNLEPAVRHWLVYFPTAEAAPEYAELSERAARVFNFLSAPKTVSEVAAAFDGPSGAQALDSLAELGVVVRQDDAAARA